MLLLGPRPPNRGILAATLAIAAAGILALTSEYPDSVRRLLSDAPPTIDDADDADDAERNPFQ